MNSNIKKAAQVATEETSSFKKSFGSFGRLAFGSLFVYQEAMTSGREYGYGYGMLKGAAYSVPYLGQAMMLYDLGKTVGNYFYDKQQSKRKLSFTSGFQDPYGTAATMRQRSQYNIQRGRATLGSEAYLFHR